MAKKQNKSNMVHTRFQRLQLPQELSLQVGLPLVVTLELARPWRRFFFSLLSTFKLQHVKNRRLMSHKCVSEQL